MTKKQKSGRVKKLKTIKYTGLALLLVIAGSLWQCNFQPDPGYHQLSWSQDQPLQEKIQKLSTDELSFMEERARGRQDKRSIRAHVDILNELAYRVSRSGTQAPIGLAVWARDRAQQIDYRQGEVDALCNLGLIDFYRSDYQAAKEKYEAAMSLARGKGNSYLKGIAQAYNGIARYYQMKGVYGQALENFIKAKEIAEEIGAKRQLATALFGFGALYYYNPKQDNNRALKNFRDCLDLARQIKDPIGETSALNALGTINLELNNFPGAEEYFTQCLEKSKKYDIAFNEANATEGLGRLAYKKKQDQQALDYYLICEKIIEKKTKNQHQKAELKKILGQFYKDKKEWDKALAYLNDALKIAQDNNIPRTQKDVLEELVEIYASQGRYAKATDAYKRLKQVTEDLQENEISKLKAISDLKLRNREAENKRNILTGIVLVTLTLLLGVLGFTAKIIVQRDQIEKSYRDIEHIGEIGQIITSTRDIMEVQNRVYDQVNNLMDATVFIIGIYDPGKERLDLPGGKEYGKEILPQFYDLTEKNRPAVKCFIEQRLLIFKNYPKEYLEKYGTQHPKPKKGKSFFSHIFLPLVIKDEKAPGGVKKIGVITVQSPQKDAYSDYHVNILKNLANYVAIAIDNANAYKKIEEQKREIEEQSRELAIRLEKEQQLNDHKDDMMRTVSHAYKTPIAIIKSSAGILRDYMDRLSEKEIDEQLNKIFANLSRMVKMINELLLFSKGFNPGLTDLGEICRKVVREIGANEGKGHELTFRADGDCKDFDVDRDLVTTILQLLIQNAVNYSDQGSAVSVSLTCNDRCATLKVADRGIGMPEDYLKMPYERFHRGSNVGNRSGTGLGLSLVKRYVDLHGGTVDIESELNEGTTVTIEIPRERPA